LQKEFHPVQEAYKLKNWTQLIKPWMNAVQEFHSVTT
jgi:hypothetical protein